MDNINRAITNLERSSVEQGKNFVSAMSRNIAGINSILNHPTLKMWREKGILKISNEPILEDPDDPLYDILIDKRYENKFNSIIGEIQERENKEGDKKAE